MGSARAAWWKVGAAVLVAGVACTSFEDGGAQGGEDAGTTGPTDASPPTDLDALPAEDASAPDACAAQPELPFELYDEPDGVQWVAADDSHVYWSTSGSSKAIKRAPVAGGTPTTFLSGQSSIAALLLTDDYVVWGPTFQLAFYARLKSSVDGTDAGAPVGDLPATIAASGPRVVGRIYSRIYRWQPPGASAILVDPVGAVEAIALDGSRVCFLAVPDGGASRAVHCLDDSGSAVPPAATFTNVNPTRLAIDGNMAYVLDPAAEKVVRVGTAAVGAELVLADKEPSLAEIAVRGPYVYYSTGAGLRRVGKDGSCKRSLTTTPLTRFALSTTHAFYVSGTKLLRVTR